MNTENVYLLGAEDWLVADTNYCTRPEAARGKEKMCRSRDKRTRATARIDPAFAVLPGYREKLPTK
ncbi:MAG: hypothetical protein Q3M30_13205 [Candidatus Electrothrix sp. Rat3]|nr:hypothetical protein [Candidatus Electrothrix rattekaaiensis]